MIKFMLQATVDQQFSERALVENNDGNLKTDVSIS